MTKDEAYARVSSTCLSFAGAEVKLSHGAPWFHVRGKMFLAFLDDHHGDGRLATWVKASLDQQRALVAADGDRFFVPPYVGAKGWVGVRLDHAAMDWVDFAILVEDAWRSIAPARIVEGREAARAGKPMKLPTTNPAKAKAALDRLASIVGALPEATMEKSATHAAFKVGKKTFAYFLDNHHGDEIIAASIKCAPGESATLVKGDPKRYYLPDYLGAHGWVGVRLDVPKVDWDDVGARVAASYAMVAPKRLASRSVAPTSRRRAGGSSKPHAKSARKTGKR